jgi:tRNA(Ile)-lysidine synthase
LMRMARGSGVSGIAGMGFLAGVPGDKTTLLIRPLLSIPKSRLVATLKAGRIPYADDPSNRDPRFTRSRIRKLMPALAREGLTAARLATLARRVEWVEDALDQAVNEAQERVTTTPWSVGAPVTMNEDAFSDLPKEISLRLLGRAIAFTGNEGPVELGKLEALRAAMSEPLSAVTLRLDQFAKFRRTLAGAVVTVTGDRITVETAPPRSPKARIGLTTRPHGRRKRSKPR